MTSHKKPYRSIFPVKHISPEGLILNAYGDVTKSFQVEYNDKFTLNAGGFNQKYTDLIKSFSLLPIGSVVHFQKAYFEEKLPLKHVKRNFAEQSLFVKYIDNKVLRETSYIHVSIPRTLTYSRDYSFLNRGLSNITALSDSRMKEQLDRVEQYLLFLRQTNICKKVIKLSVKELSERVLPQVFLGGQQHLVDIKTQDTQLRIGEKIAKVYAVCDNRDLPRHSSTATRSVSHNLYREYLEPICDGLRCEHIVNSKFFLDDPALIKAQAEKQLTRIKTFQEDSIPNQLAGSKIENFLYSLEEDNPLRQQLSVVTFSHSDAQHA